jgi:hypothetical protein
VAARPVPARDTPDTIFHTLWNAFYTGVDNDPRPGPHPRPGGPPRLLPVVNSDGENYTPVTLSLVPASDVGHKM